MDDARKKRILTLVSNVDKVNSLLDEVKQGLTPEELKQLDLKPPTKWAPRGVKPLRSKESLLEERKKKNEKTLKMYRIK